MNEIPTWSIILAVLAAILTTMVSWKTLKGHPILGNPVIPVCVGLIALVGLCTNKGAGKALPVIIIPYVTLALALPIALFLLLFTRRSFKPGQSSSDSKVSEKTKGESAHTRKPSSQTKGEENVHYDDETDD